MFSGFLILAQIAKFTQVVAQFFTQFTNLRNLLGNLIRYFARNRASFACATTCVIQRFAQEQGTVKMNFLAPKKVDPLSTVGVVQTKGLSRHQTVAKLKSRANYRLIFSVERVLALLMRFTFVSNFIAIINRVEQLITLSNSERKFQQKVYMDILGFELQQVTVS